MMRLSCLLIIAAAIGCSRDDIHVYRVAKDQANAAAAGPSFGGMGGVPPPLLQDAGAAPESSGESGDIRWKAPPDWKAQPASGMRFASFEVPGKNGAAADMSVVAFPGAAGGMIGNVNRWRGQVGLRPWSEETLNKQVQRLKCKAGDLTLVDFVGMDQKSAPPRKVRMLGAILPAAGRTWFFKLMGDESTVKSAKPSFLKFLKSLNHGPA